MTALDMPIMERERNLESEVVPFQFEGRSVRVVEQDGETWFVASDVARELGYSHTAGLTRSVDEDEKGVHSLHTPGGEQEITIVSEPGLYRAIVQRRMNKKHDDSLTRKITRFQRWVFHDVLPSIRATGSYVSPQAALPADVLDMIRRVDGISRMLSHKVTTIEQSLLGVVDDRIEQRIASDSRIAVVRYVSVKQILENEWKVPSKGRRSIQRKVFIRLQAYCLANGIKAFKCAHSGTWLFPPHEAGAFVREHCAGLIHEHLARMKGQNTLRLVENA